jgi:predicted GNAT family N-acyltransferase
MPEPAGLERRVTDWTRDGATMDAICRAVFVVEQGVPAELEWDGLVAGCTHVLALMNRDPVGTGRLLPTGKIGRLAVVAGARRHGIGRCLLRRLVELAREQGLTPVCLHAQVSSASFYEAHGFVAEGAEFDEAGIRHGRMRLAVPAQQRTDAAPDGAAHAALVRR